MLFYCNKFTIILGGENMEELTTFISSTGFPIVACVFMYKQQLKLQETITELSSTLKTIDARIENLERRERNEL